MNNVLEAVEIEVRNRCEKFHKKDGYDFWNEHIKYVVKNARTLAKRNNADEEIVALGALLHDIALPSEIGPRDEHHIYGAQIAEKLLKEVDYPQEKIIKVKKCIRNHRKPFVKNNSISIEETCLSDADALAHFDCIPMLFHLAYSDMNLSVSEGEEFLKKKLQKSFNKMSLDTQKMQRDRYDNILKTLFNE